MILVFTCHLFCHWLIQWLSRSAALHRTAEQVAFTSSWFAALCCSISTLAAICPVLKHISVRCGMHQSTFYTNSIFTIKKIHNFLPDMIPHTQVPVYAHVKEVVDPQGNLEAVEINYMKFLAFNGSYKVCAVPCCAMLCYAVLCCVTLCGTVLCCAVL